MPGIAPRWAAWQLKLGNPPGPFLSAGEPLTVTFPATSSLVTHAWIALGADLSADPATWAWQDISDRVRYVDGITVTSGRRDESDVVTPSVARLRLDNRDGHFSRRNPMSPYYGLLSQNTPIWLAVDAGSGVKTRYQGFVNEWPVRWTDKSGNDTTVPIVCAGPLRRLGQTEVLKSPLRRAILASSPAEYWPMEDGADAASAGSATGGTPLTTRAGTPVYAAVSTVTGSGPLPNLTGDGSVGASLQGSASKTTSSASWTVEYVGVVASTGGGVGTPVEVIVSGGTYASFLFGQFGDFQFTAYDAAGTPTVICTVPGDVEDDLPHHYRVTATDSGANLDFELFVDGVSDTGSLVAANLGRITSVRVNGGRYPAQVTVGHLAIYDGVMSADHSGAAEAYVGELAHVRLGRLCQEEGVPFVTLASSSVAMGPQQADSFLTVVRECESADMGVLFETGWGLGYQARTERYNAPVALTLDFDLRQIAETPEPADDDQQLRNRWTVSRRDGSEYTAELDSGPLGTGAGGPGIYDRQVTLNVETDDQLPSQANWRVHLGTVDEDRWPALDLNFARSPELIDVWTSLPYGPRINALHPPDKVAPDAIDAFAEGHVERWDDRTWRASLNTAPATPFLVHVVGSTDGNLGRVDMANSTLAADATSGATTISVASPGALWRTGSVNFDIDVAGERMTVTNISGGSSPQIFTVVRSMNGVVKAQLATVGGITTRVRLWRAAAYAL